MTLLLTQKESKDKYKQHIDSLEHDYVKYFSNQHFDKIVLVPNNEDVIESLVSEAEAIVLTGGGDVGNQQKRDKIEKMLIGICMQDGIPLLGICRGMQFINTYFGGSLVKNKRKCNDVNVHNIVLTDSDFVQQIGKRKGPVNSYHNFAVAEHTLSKKLNAFAIADTGYIEGIYHPDYPIIGIQWHPERNNGLSRWIDSKIIDWLQDITFIW